MVLKLGLVVLAIAFLASTVLAYYPYGPEYRIYGTDTYLRTGTYPLYYDNYVPQTYTVYSGDYASYTGYYYAPEYSAFSGYAMPSAYAYPSYAYPSVYTGNYYPYYYLRGYPQATAYATYNASPGIVYSPYHYAGYAAPYQAVPSYSVYIGNESPSVSVGYSHTDNSDYYGGNACTESWCVRLN